MTEAAKVTVAGAGSAAVGVVPREVAASMSGREFLERLRDGRLPFPPFGATMGIRLIEVEHGRVVFEGQPARDFYNPLGSVHGGWIATLLDTAMACAVQSALPAGQTFTTLELKSNFVRPVFDATGVLRCEGVLLSVGGRIASSEGKVYDRDRNLIAHGSETCLIIRPQTNAERLARGQ